MKISRKIKGIIWLGSAVVILGSVLVILLLTAPEETESSVSSEVYGAGIELIFKNPADVNKIKIYNLKDEFTVLRTPGGTDEDGVRYTIEGYEKLDLDNMLLSTLANNASNLSSMSVVEENSDSIEKYGLNNPEARVEMFYDSGESIEFRFTQNPAEASVYFMLEGDDRIFTVALSKMSNYSRAKNDFISKSIVPESDEKPVVQDIRISRKDMDNDIFIENTKKTTQSYNGTEIDVYVMREPVYSQLGYENSQPVIDSLFTLNALDFYSIFPTEGKIAEVGLNNPFCTVSVTCQDGKTYKLLMSEMYPDPEAGNFHYAMLEGGDIIYTVAAENAVWCTVKDVNLISILVYGSTIWDVREMIFSGRDFDTKEIIASGVGNKETYSVTKNGEEFDKERFRQLYAFVLSTTPETIVPDGEVPDEEPLVRISIYDTSMSEPQIVEYYEKSKTSCLLVIDGECRFTCSRSYVDTLIDNIGRMDTGEEYVKTWKN